MVANATAVVSVCVGERALVLVGPSLFLQVQANPLVER